MNREDKICLVLEGLVNGVDCETGEAYSFSDTVTNSLKAVSVLLECKDRNKTQETHKKIVTRVSTYSAVDLALKMFGVGFQEVKGRLAKPGWFYTGSTQVRCPVCNNQFEVLRKPYITKAKLTYHYYALVCGKCSTIITPTELPDEERRELYKDHQIDAYDEDANNHPSNTPDSDYFKIESYPTVRVLNSQWIGGVEEIQKIRSENITNNREINSGIPISLEEIDLFTSWAESGKSLREIQDFFQRNISSLDKFLSKYKVRREKLINKSKVVDWDKNQDLESPSNSDSNPISSYSQQVKAVNNNQVVNNPCIDCECEIPRERLEKVSDTIRCTPCQSEFEKSNPESIARKVKEEGILTREGAKRMRAKQYGTNIHNKI